MKFFNNFGLNNFNNISFLAGVKKESENEPKKQNIFENSLQEPPRDLFEKSSKRINDLDVNILNKNLIQYLPSDSLRIELQLENAENNLKNIKEKINAVKLLDLDNSGNKLAELEKQKLDITDEIQDYRSQYRSLGFVYKVADMFSDTYSKSKEKLDAAKIAFTGHPTIQMFKNLIPGMKKAEELKLTLNKFCTLQSSMSGILSKSVNPFGEAESNINDFITLMNKANKLDSQTNKFLNATNQAKLKIKNVYSNTVNSVKIKANSIKEYVVSFFQSK